MVDVINDVYVFINMLLSFLFLNFVIDLEIKN